MNQKDERILKLHAKGLSLEKIASKIGYGNPPSKEGLERIKQALARK